jgi:dTDP-4-dehydrorhamnose reductase
LVNVFGAQNLAVAAKSVGAVFVHISTDYVFAGDKESPYQEDDPVGPVSVYGMSKEAGESAVRAHCAKYLILRTAWVLSATRRNFLTTMLDLAETRDVLNVVADQHGSPTSASDIARVVKVLLERHLVDQLAPCGIYHCVNSGYGTWADLAEKIFEISKNLGGTFAQVNRIMTADYPTAARRPSNSRLLTDKLERDFGQKLPHWHDAIPSIVRDVLKRVS